jgi:hypothetical protein
MSKIIPFDKTLKIVNTEQLARGTGAKYLEVIEAHIPGIYIAKQWRRKPNDKEDNILIEHKGEVI